MVRILALTTNPANPCPALILDIFVNRLAIMKSSLPELAFRQARLDDTETIVALVNGAYRGDTSRRGWTTEADLLDGQRTDTGEIADLIATPDNMLLLALASGRIVASVHIMKQAEDAYLGMLTVDPLQQGRGIGKQLMRQAEGVAKEAWKAQRMQMTVISVRQELIAFYERQGYVMTGELQPFPKEERFGIPKVFPLQFAVLTKPL